MPIRLQLDRAKAARQEAYLQLLDENPEFFLYDLMQPGAGKVRVERSLWVSTPKFRFWHALCEVIASYEHVI